MNRLLLAGALLALLALAGCAAPVNSPANDTAPAAETEPTEDGLTGSDPADENDSDLRDPDESEDPAPNDSDEPGRNNSEPERDTYFEPVRDERGIDYETNAEALYGNSRGGAYATDYNNDGYTDVLAVGGDEPVLFENDNGSFSDSGRLPAVEGTLKTAFVFDYDADGWEDIVLFPMSSPPVLLENEQGSFTHTDGGFELPLEMPHAASAADYNDDGCLDLFVAVTGNWSRGLPYKATRPDKDLDIEDNGNRNVLYRGDCSSFERVVDAGITGEHWSLAATFTDLTGDGRPDIHVANDFYAQTLLVNQGNDSFEQRAIPNTDRNGMASEILDANADGRPDIFVTNIHISNGYAERLFPGMSNAGNSLLINQPNGSFESQQHQYGVMDGKWGWAVSATDYNNDGRLDITQTTSNYVDVSNRNVTAEQSSLLWFGTENDRFDAETRRSGFDATESRGMVSLDFDRDGDMDILETSTTDQYTLYENTLEQGNWLQLSLERTNGSAVMGTELTVRTANTTQHRWRNAKADLYSQDSRTLQFGLGNETEATVELRHPDGSEQTVTDVQANQRLILSPDGTLRVATKATA